MALPQPSPRCARGRAHSTPMSLCIHFHSQAQAHAVQQRVEAGELGIAARGEDAVEVFPVELAHGKGAA